MTAVPMLLLVVAFSRPEACYAFALPAATPAFDTQGEALDRGGTKYPIRAIATPPLCKHIEPVADMEEFETQIASKSKQVGYIKGHLDLGDEKRLLFHSCPINSLLTVGVSTNRVLCAKLHFSLCHTHSCPYSLEFFHFTPTPLLLVKNRLGLLPVYW